MQSSPLPTPTRDAHPYIRAALKIKAKPPRGTAPVFQLLSDTVEAAPLNSCLWYILEPIRFKYKGRTFQIPLHFSTDFYSIPPPFRPFFPVNPGRLSLAALAHDYLIRYRKTEKIGLMYAHGCLRDAMRALGGGWRTWPVYLGVILGGWVCPGPGDGTPPQSHLPLLLALESNEATQ